MNVDSAKIKEQLSFDCEVELLETIDSTNLYLKRKGAVARDMLVVAKTQTAGKGRHGKSFYSDENGIYMSLLINKTIPVKDIYLLTVSAAVAVAEALNDLFGIDAKIKWVNDIYCGNKKLCGILCEGVLNSEGCYERSIIGIGINVFKSPFPAEINDIATSLENFVDSSRIDKKEIVSNVSNRLFDLIFHSAPTEIVERYRHASLMIGREIAVLTAEGSYRATVLDIDQTAQLVIRKETGEILSLNSGEISIKL